MCDTYICASTDWLFFLYKTEWLNVLIVIERNSDVLFFCLQQEISPMNHLLFLFTVELKRLLHAFVMDKITNSYIKQDRNISSIFSSFQHEDLIIEFNYSNR